MKRFVKTMAFLLALTMLFALIGCAGDGAGSGDQVPAEAADAAQDTAQKPDNGGGDAEYAVILKVLSNQFWQSMADGIQDEAARLGVKVDVYAANTEEDVEGQVSLLENAISKGYKAIGLAPISSNNLNNAIADATGKGIYIVNIDEVVDLESLHDLGGAVYSFVASDNTQIGRLGGQYIVDTIVEGDVAIIQGKAGNITGEARKTGAEEAMLEGGLSIVDIQPADWDRTKAYDLTTNLISKHPDLRGIYCCNDTMAMGALEAVKNAGKEIVVVGTDGNDDALDSIRAGELDATVAQEPGDVGARALQLMVEAVGSGDPIDPDAEPLYESVSSTLISKD